MKRNGTTTAHNRTWPLYERRAFSVEVLGSIDADDLRKKAEFRRGFRRVSEAKQLEAVSELADELRVKLQEVLDRYHLDRDGVTVKVEPRLVLFMRPEDQAEKEALDAVVQR